MTHLINRGPSVVMAWTQGSRRRAAAAGTGLLVLLASLAAEAETPGPFDAHWRGTLSCGPGTGNGPRTRLPLDIAVEVTVSAGKFDFDRTLPSGLHVNMAGKLSLDGKLSVSGEGEPPSGAPQPLPLLMSGAVKDNIIDGSGSWGSRHCSLMLATESGNIGIAAHRTGAPAPQAASAETPAATLTRAPEQVRGGLWRGRIECGAANIAGPSAAGGSGNVRPLSIPVETRVQDGKFDFSIEQRDGLRGAIHGVVEDNGRLILKGRAQGAGGPRPEIVALRGTMKGGIINASGSWGDRDCTMRLTGGAVQSAANAPLTPPAKPDGQAGAVEAAQAGQERTAIEAERKALEAEKQKLAQAAAQFEQQQREERARLAQVQLAEQQAKTAAAEAERQRQEAEKLQQVALAKQQAERVAEQQRQQSQLDFDPGRYFALVIGNNNYKTLPKLKTAIGDAKAVAQLLSEKYGFQVTVLNDATRYQILTALTKLRAQLKFEDNLLIYYAGHGVLDEAAERGYWLPIDADADNPSNWVSTVDLTDSLRAMEARHVMIVADSCYSGTLLRGVATAPRPDGDRRVWLKRMEEKRSRTALTSGGLEPVMDGGGSGHSIFTKAFIDALSDNNDPIDGQTLFGLIRRPVVLNADQTPAYADIRSAGHDGGDFVLVPAALLSMRRSSAGAH